ncbi:MAG: hypothetical protein IK990_12335 [Ruminiclostridium sp.]|nr:hypothetical protein [Ruminiclostridium sp.]
MKTKEEKLIEAIGDTKDSNVLRAVGHESADPNLKTEVRHMEIIDVPKPSEADIRRYRIRNGVLGGLAAAVAITGGVVLWNNLKDIQTEPKPAESSVTEPIVTIYTPDLAVDPLSIITDTSMPEPFAPNENSELYGGDGWHDEFNDLWQKRFTSINTDLIGTICTEFPEYINRAEELATQYQDAQGADIQAGNVTRYGIDDTPNIYRYMKDLGLTGEEMESVLIYYDNEIHRQINEGADLDDRLFDFDSMYFGRENKADIAVAFKSEYSIVSGEYVLSPRWMYYHTIEDYEKVNVFATQIRIMLPKYKELGFTDEAWEAFSTKLEDYIETHKVATEEKRYIIDTENYDLTSDTAISILEDHFYGEWNQSDDDELILPLTYKNSPFDFEGFHRPLCFAETEDIWYMLCINSGESEIFVIEKSDPDVMYQTGLSYFNGYNSTPVVELGSEMSIKYTREDIPADKTLPTGEISLLAEYKLFNMYGEDFKTFYNETLNNGFTFEDGMAYVTGGDMMTAGADRYLEEYRDDLVLIGARYFVEDEYNDYLEKGTAAPGQHWFGLTFEKDWKEKWSVTYAEYDLPYEVVGNTVSIMGERPEYSPADDVIAEPIDMTLDCEQILLDKAEKLHEMISGWGNVDRSALAFELGEKADDFISNDGAYKVISDKVRTYADFKALYDSDIYGEYIDALMWEYLLEVNGTLYYIDPMSGLLGTYETWYIGCDVTEDAIVGHFAILCWGDEDNETTNAEFLNDVSHYKFYDINVQNVGGNYVITSCGDGNDIILGKVMEHGLYYNSGAADRSLITNEAVKPKK